MMNSPALDLSVVWLVAARGGAALALLWLLGQALRYAPLPPRHRRIADRFAPVVTLGGVGVVVVASAGQLLAAQAMPVALWGAVASGLLVAGLWAPLRDVLAGVVIKSSLSLQPGDEISLQNVRGRVLRLGLRGLLLRTAAGETFVPYARYVRAIVVRSPRGPAASAYSFRVRPTAGVSQSELRNAIRESVLLCHWSSPAHEPELCSLDEGALEVRVAAIDPDHATEIEASVRRRLEALERSRSLERIPRLSQAPANTQTSQPAPPERRDMRNPR